MTVYYDVSVTFWNGLNTGIQRVVRSIAGQDHLKELKLVLGDKKISTQLYIIEHEEFLSKQEQTGTKPKLLVSNGLIFLRKFRFLISVVNKSKYGILLKEWIQKKISPQYKLSKNIEKRKPISIRLGDVYITFDAFWNSEKDLARIAFAKSQGATVIIFVHDILPITHPEWFEKSNIINFQKHFTEGIKNADILLFSSDSVKEEFKNKFPTEKLQISKIPLGSSHFHAQTVKKPWSSKGPLIMVGTIEPRKNYSLVLKWFTNANILNQLVIVGRPGWKSLRVRASIYSLKLRRRNILWLRNASDLILREQLGKASVGICASLDEGYGLPLREFLEAGIPVVASDIPVFRELHSKNIEYFDPNSQHELNEAIGKILDHGFTDEILKLPEWTTAHRMLITMANVEGKT